MAQAAVFSYIENVLNKLRVPICLIRKTGDGHYMPDFGLRRLAGREREYERLVNVHQELVAERTIYHYTDEFLCNYNSFHMQYRGEDCVVLIGPYLRVSMENTRLMELAQELSIPPRLAPAFIECYTNIPIIADESFYYAMLNSFAELLWGGSSAYELVELERETVSLERADFGSVEQQEQTDTLVSMQLMEDRYKWENELISMIAHGQIGRAEKMVPVGGGEFIKRRIADPVRNMKNYAVICNTIMRKAAEQGGVHPFYLDRISTDFALRIEAQTSAESAGKLILEMIRDYCRLVRKHSMKDYSPQVRRAVLLIDSELSSDLSLRGIAEKLGMNASYLSTVFKKETGSSITDYISRRRMDHAADLLKNTGLQVQNIAQYCGINDANYFSKLFKKYRGMTPAEYRNSPGRQN